MTAHIFVNGEIGKETTLESVKNQFHNVGDPSEIEVSINSIGGDVREGYAIRDFLKAQNLPITTVNVGQCYSIATVIHLAGDKDKRLVSENAEFMYHNPWMNAGSGDGKTLKSLSENLLREEEKLAQFYSKETGINLDDVKSLMDKETFMYADEAVKVGFASKIQAKLKAVAKINMEQKEKENQKKTLLQRFMNLLEGEEEVKAMEGTLENGAYTLADGRQIMVQDGMIMQVVEEAPAEEAEVEVDAMKTFKEELAAMKEQIAQMASAKQEIEAKKEEEINALKAKHDTQIKALNDTAKELKALVITEEAPKTAVKSNASAEKKKSYFDTLIQN